MHFMQGGWEKAHGSAFKVCPLRTVRITEELAHPAPLTIVQRMGKYLALERRGEEVKNKVSLKTTRAL